MKLLAFVGIVLLFAIIAPWNAAAAQTQPAQSRNLTGQGSVTSTDGCIQTYTEVFVVESWNHQPPGAPTDVTSATVEISQTDMCAQTALHHIIGGIEGVQFSADNRLRSGALTACFPNFRDLVTRLRIAFQVHVIWNGTEAQTVSRTHEVQQTDDGRINV